MKVQAKIKIQRKEGDYPQLSFRIQSFSVCNLEKEGLTLEQYKERIMTTLTKKGYRGPVFLQEIRGGPGRGNRKCFSTSNAVGFRQLESFEVI